MNGSARYDRMLAARRLGERVEAWRTGTIPFPRQGAHFCEVVAPLALPLMYDRIERVEPVYAEHAEYHLFSREHGGVALSTSDWVWYSLDGMAGETGFIPLWSWRWDVPLFDAYMDLITLAAPAAVPEKRRRRA